MLYEALLYAHITALVGWAGLSTGGYHVFKSGAAAWPRYRQLVYVQFASAVALFATGVAMAIWIYNFPKSPLWIHYSLGVALAAGLVEVYHLYNALDAGGDPSRYKGGRLIPAWVAIYAVMMYLMIFKPTF
ncbi:MAG: hypothetical protein QXT27_07525 [Pyrobaculum sp.]